MFQKALVKTAIVVGIPTGILIFVWSFFQLPTIPVIVEYALRIYGIALVGAVSFFWFTEHKKQTVNLPRPVIYPKRRSLH